MIWAILFFLSVFLIFHSYMLYPLLVQWLAKRKSPNQLVFETEKDFPEVTVILAAHNEEKVIRQKIESTFRCSYPQEKIKMLIGSDASTDQTNMIVSELQQKYNGLRLKAFEKRTGKAGIINQLATEADTPVLILTDANVIFTEKTIVEMVKHFKNEEIKLVGGNIVNSHNSIEGISIQEEKYISRENRIKYAEGVLWGTMAGAFGGCYAIRKEYFSPVPPRFFMDDFYITMNVLEKGGKAVMELKALCFEDVSNKPSEEFRRKIRISIGNYQNLLRYKKLIFSSKPGLSFSFISHKILRWLGPFFLILAFVSNIFLLQRSGFYQLTFYIQLGLLLIPLLDTFLRSIKVHLTLLRLISHFYFMNMALLIGFFRFLKGVESNIWQPTQRFQ